MRQEVGLPDRLVGEGLKYLIEDRGHLDPFTAMDRYVCDSAKEPWMPLMVGTPSHPSLVPYKPMFIRNARVHEFTTPKPTCVVLESRRFLFKDHIARLWKRISPPEVFNEVMHRASKSYSQQIDLPESYEMTFEFSDELVEEVEGKVRLQRNFVGPLCEHIHRHYTLMNKPIEFSDTTRGTPKPQRSGDHSGEALWLPAPSFEGKRSSAFSAAALSKLSQAQPTMPRLHKLDYELVALSFRLGLCMNDFYQKLVPRMTYELECFAKSRGQGSASESAELLVQHQEVQRWWDIVNDPSLHIADRDFSGAVRWAAKYIA
jgi:hypothetical protein